MKSLLKKSFRCIEPPQTALIHLPCQYSPVCCAPQIIFIYSYHILSFITTICVQNICTRSTYRLYEYIYIGAICFATNPLLIKYCTLCDSCNSYPICSWPVIIHFHQWFFSVVVFVALQSTIMSSECVCCSQYVIIYFPSLKYNYNRVCGCARVRRAREEGEN